MKTKKKIWISLSLGLAVSVITIVGVLYSCEKQDIQPMSSNDSVMKTDSDLPIDIFDGRDICGEIERKALVVDGMGRVGSVFVFNGTKYFYVYVSAFRNFSLRNAYLFTGTRAELPLNLDGDLEIKRFQHQIISDEASTTRVFRIPISEMHGRSVISLMVQAKNDQGDFSRYKNAWAQGKEYGTITIGHVLTYDKRICLVNDPVGFDE